MNPYTLVILPIIAGFAAWYLLGSFKFAFFAFTLAVPSVSDGTFSAVELLQT